jgi:hypothetical protein
VQLADHTELRLQSISISDAFNFNISALLLGKSITWLELSYFILIEQVISILIFRRFLQLALIASRVAAQGEFVV